MIKPQGRQRISKEDMYLNSAENFAYRSTCLKRKYGAVIVKDDAVISTGYNGSPRGFENCCDIGVCPRMQRNMHQGEGYGMCRAIHAEANALLNCSREQTLGADLYLTVSTRRIIPFIRPDPVRYVPARSYRQAFVTCTCARARDRISMRSFLPETCSGIFRSNCSYAA